MDTSVDLLTKINDEFLTCQICFETYTRPKSLNCQHTFCLRCLLEYTPKKSPTVTCPTCRSEQTLTAEGINGLKDNFFISSMSDMLKTVKEIRSDEKDGTSLLCETCDYDSRKIAIARCLDCTDFLCHECSLWHPRTKLTRHHKIVSLCEFESGIHNEELKSRAKIYCMIHEGEITKLYCQTCQCPICHECLNSGHERHRICTLKEEVESQGNQIEELLKKSKVKGDLLRTLQNNMKEIKKRKKIERDKTQMMIEQTCEHFINAIHRRMQELIDDLHAKYAVEIKQMDSEEDSVELQLSSLISCSEFSMKVLEYGTPKEVLGLNNQMTLILQQLLQTHPAPAYHRKREIDVSFFDTNLNSSVRVVRDNLGKVTSKKILLEEEIGKVLDELDSFCSEGRKNAPQNTNKIPVTETSEVAEIRLIAQPGKQGIGDGEFESTPYLTVNSVNEIITADFDGSRVQIFDPDANFKDSFVTEIDSHLCKPTGLAVLKNDDVVVCFEDKIHIWTHEGKSVLGFGKGFFGNCTCITVNSENRIIAADALKHFISVHTDTGKLLIQFGQQAKGDHKLSEPRYLACDSANNIIVSDGGDCSIKKFSSQGEFLLSFGSEGPERGQFQGPRGVCTDEHDNILVSDCWNHRVDLFSPDGCFIKHIATDFDNLHFPWDIALTSSNKLVLSEDYSWSVKLFSLPGEPEHSVSNDELVSAPVIPDFEHLASQLDIASIFSNKVSWWLTSSTLHNSSSSESSKAADNSMDSNGQNGTYKPKSRSSSMRKSVSKADSDLLASSPTSTLHSGTLESSADAKLNLHSPVHRNNSATEDTLLALTNGTI